MRGIPKNIQTRADLQNLFAMAQNGELEKSALLMRCLDLLAKQYHSVPILSVEGATITTYYFPECKKGDTTAEGLTVKEVKHIEDKENDEEGVQYAETHITLSKAPTDKTVLSVFMADNAFQKKFDVAEINYIQGVLEQ